VTSPILPSIRLSARSVLPSPPSSAMDPPRETSAGCPKSGAPSDTLSARIAPMFTATGSSGRENPFASALTLPSGIGARGMSMLAAESSLTSIRPDKSAVRSQAMAPSLIVSQTPSPSEMVIRLKVARDDSAPAKPSMLTVRPRPERLRSRNEVR